MGYNHLSTDLVWHTNISLSIRYLMLHPILCCTNCTIIDTMEIINILIVTSYSIMCTLYRICIWIMSVPRVVGPSMWTYSVKPLNYSQMPHTHAVWVRYNDVYFRPKGSTFNFFPEIRTMSVDFLNLNILCPLFWNMWHKHRTISLLKKGKAYSVVLITVIVTDF